MPSLWATLCGAVVGEGLRVWCGVPFASGYGRIYETMTAKPTTDQFTRYHAALTRRSVLRVVLDALGRFISRR